MAFFAIIAAGCAGNKAIRVDEAWSRPSLLGNNAVVYFVLRNNSTTADTLLGASSEIARAVELHQSMIVAADGMAENDELDGMIVGAEHQMEGMQMGDTMQMMPLTELTLSPGEKIDFEPGSYHVMLIDVNRELKTGDIFNLTLHFKNSPDLVIQVTVEDN